MIKKQSKNKGADFYDEPLDKRPVIQSEIGPVNENTFIVSGKKNLFFYQFRFYNLKAQINILNTIDQQLQILSFKTENEKDNILINKARDLVSKLKSCKYKNITDVSDSVIEKASNILKNKHLNPELEKLTSLLFSSAITIYRTFNFYYGKEVSELNTSPISSKSDYSEDNTVICRICDEHISMDSFETHLKACIKAYNSGTKCSKTDKQIEDQIDLIKKHFLKDVVPSNEEKAVRMIMPMFHLTFILTEALKINPSMHDCGEVLKLISLKTLYDLVDQRFIDVLASAEKLIKEKTRIVRAIREAGNVLSSTRISGNSKSAHGKKVTISDFHFVKRISSGAFASVFIAKKKNTGDIFAIKAIPKKSIQQKNTSERLNAEKEILRSFNNPYLVSFYYSIIGNRNYYIVTEYVPGGDLYSLLQNVGSFDEDTSRAYFIQILEALKYLRENGIIHRDLKPDNILICGNGSIKLIDFGVSFQGCCDRSFTDCNTNQNQPKSEVVGTPDYMAPEIILAKHHDFSVDYWSLGIILYEFLYGTAPFHGENEKETITNIIRGNITFNPEFDISPEANDLISKLLTHKKENRIGAKDINEIFKHKWLNGLTHDKVKPPFIPDLESRTDTQYFEQRYEFQTVSDKDIIADIIECDQNSNLSEESKDMSDFETTSIQNLADQSKQEFAQKSTHRLPSEMLSVTNLLIEE